MPLFHIHSFLFLSLVFAIWVAAQRAMKAGLPTFLWAVVPATWCLARLTNPSRAASFVWLKPGWLIENQNVFTFLAVNFGFFLLLAAWATVAAAARKSREHLLLLVPAVGLFALGVTTWTRALVLIARQTRARRSTSLS